MRNTTLSYQLTRHPLGSIRELWTIASPLMLSALSASLMMFLDRLIVAKYSLEAFNAVSVVVMICALFQYGAVGITSIAEVFVGQYNGSDQPKKMGEPVWQMIYFSLATLVVFVPAALYGRDILIPDQLNEHGIPYFKWIMLFGLGPAIIAALASFFIGQGKVKLVLWVTVGGNILNVLLDILLVFGYRESIPEMGAEGAAIATVVSQLFQVAILFAVFLSPRNRAEHKTAQARVDISAFLKCLKIGVPNAVSHMIEIGAWSLIMILMTQVSQAHITILAIGQSVFHLVGFMNDGMQKGVITVASNFIGARQPDLVHKMVRSGILLQFILGAALVTPLILYPDLIMDQFITQETTFATKEELATYIRFAFMFMWLFFVFDGITWVFAGVLTAGGDTVFTMIMNGAAAWCFGIVPSYFFVVKGGAPAGAVWSIFAGYAMLNSFCFFLRYRQHKWKSKEVIERATEIANP